MDSFFEIKEKKDIEKEHIKSYKKSLIHYIKNEFVASNLIQCKEPIFKFLYHEISNIKVNGNEIYDFINPAKDTVSNLPLITAPNNLIQKFGESGKNIMYNFCNSVLFCMFWKYTKYDNLLLHTAKSEDMYEIFMNDKGYNLRKYKKIRGNLYEMITDMRGPYNKPKELKYSKHTITMLKLSNEYFKIDGNLFSDAYSFYSNLVSLMDYTNEYKIYVKDYYSWIFKKDEFQKLINTYGDAKNYLEKIMVVNDKDITIPILYESQVHTTEFIVPKEINSLADYIRYISISNKSNDIYYFKDLYTHILKVPPPKGFTDITCTQLIERVYVYIPNSIVISVENGSEFSIESSVGNTIFLWSETCKNREALLNNYSIISIIYYSEKNYIIEILYEKLWISSDPLQQNRRTTKEMLSFHKEKNSKPCLLFAIKKES